jgi:MmyB-like transcription regulator ligand binding domain
MILRLAEQLEIPLRDRNVLLLAGGCAPAYRERGLADPELAAITAALRRVLAGHRPHPAAVVNRWWELFRLCDELEAYPGGQRRRPSPAEVVVPLRYHADQGELSFISMTAVVGTPLDITVEELAIESFYPADEPTAAALRP